MAPQLDCPLILPLLLEDSEQKLKPSGHSVNLHLLLFDGRIGLGLDRTTGNAHNGLSRPTALVSPHCSGPAPSFYELALCMCLSGDSPHEFGEGGRV